MATSLTLPSPLCFLKKYCGLWDNKILHKGEISNGNGFGGHTKKILNPLGVDVDMYMQVK